VSFGLTGLAKVREHHPQKSQRQITQHYIWALLRLQAQAESQDQDGIILEYNKT
jgi:hypothetical protein